MTERYVPQAFWERTIAEDFTLPGITFPTFPKSLNVALYRSFANAVDRALRSEGVVDIEAKNVLDVGPGIGMWIEFWRRRGARKIVGLDITDAGFGRLHARFPDVELIRGDIGDSKLQLDDRFDLISAVSVLLHVTDDSRWEQAISNLAAALKPNGLLIVIDVPYATTHRGPHLDDTAIERRRSLDHWAEGCGRHGLRISRVEPATVVLSTPIEASTRAGWKAAWAYWRLLMKFATGRERVGRTIAPPLSIADRILTRVVRTGPAAKCLSIRRAT